MHSNNEGGVDGEKFQANTSVSGDSCVFPEEKSILRSKHGVNC